MEPVQIKLYGWFKHTKTSYLKQQLFSVLLTLSLLPVWLLVPSLKNFEPQARPTTNRHDGMLPKYEIEATRSPLAGLSPQVIRMIGLLSLLPWIVLGMLILIATETAIVLRQFARKESERSATLLSSDGSGAAAEGQPAVVPPLSPDPAPSRGNGG